MVVVVVVVVVFFVATVAACVCCTSCNKPELDQGHPSSVQFFVKILETLSVCLLKHRYICVVFGTRLA